MIVSVCFSIAFRMSFARYQKAALLTHPAERNSLHHILDTVYTYLACIEVVLLHLQSIPNIDVLSLYASQSSQLMHNPCRFSLASPQKPRCLLQHQTAQVEAWEAAEGPTILAGLLLHIMNTAYTDLACVEVVLLHLQSIPKIDVLSLQRGPPSWPASSSCSCLSPVSMSPAPSARC